MLFFSLFSGELVESDELIKDPHYIPLRHRPIDNCRKCYGRFYTHYNLTHKQYEICSKCLPKCLDGELMIEMMKEERQNAAKPTN